MSKVEETDPVQGSSTAPGALTTATVLLETAEKSVTKSLCDSPSDKDARSAPSSDVTPTTTIVTFALAAHNKASSVAVSNHRSVQWLGARSSIPSHGLTV